MSAIFSDKSTVKVLKIESDVQIENKRGVFFLTQPINVNLMIPVFFADEEVV